MAKKSKTKGSIVKKAKTAVKVRASGPAKSAKSPKSAKQAKPVSKTWVVEIAVTGRVTTFGEDIYVRCNGHEHPMQWASHDTWQGSVALPVNREVEYQFVVKCGGQEVDRTSTRRRVFTKDPVRDSWHS
ncbi:MAG: hypothetical protein A2583_09990 [Bdellovibrionales bacterium RIFOXYD1_FULL_53_11]|nr:MAG: hypothetical protein A2583_09990 [Bdellovibrionales bacterium RIFOXYD1_FULL_53_11]